MKDNTVCPLNFPPLGMHHTTQQMAYEEKDFGLGRKRLVKGHIKVL